MALPRLFVKKKLFACAALQKKQALLPMNFIDFSHALDDPARLASLMVCGVVVGMSKTGIQGIMTLVIPIMALIFGGKESTGVVLPMLCFADLIAVAYYRRQAQWLYILKLLPCAILGFFLAIWADSMIDKSGFNRLMGLCIFAGFLAMFFTRKNSNEENQEMFSKWWCAAIFGILGGFTTMIGNAAGPIMAVYLLSMRLPKYAFVGTSAWFFLIVNYLKIPLQIFAWGNITPQTIALDMLTIPAILLGAVFGVYFVKCLPEKSYRAFVIAMSLVSTALLML